MFVNSRALDSFDQYLFDVEKYPLIEEAAEERELARRARTGDKEAAERLVTANLRFVISYVKKYQGRGLGLAELVCIGNEGLLKAVKKFDPDKGVKFISYAVWWIRAYMLRYIMNDWRMVKIGTTQAQRKLFFNLQKEKERIEAEGLAVGPKLLAQRLNVKEDEVIEMEQRLASRDLSVDVPIGDDDEATLLHFLPDHKQNPEEEYAESQYQRMLREKMEQFAKGLKDKELVIYRERLLNEDPLTLREIGDKYGISRERVRQIEERVKKKLKSYLSKEFKDATDISGAG